MRVMFFVYIRACFSGHSDPQSSAQREICHICHCVLHEYKQRRESANTWQLTDRMTSAAMTDDSSFKCKNSYVQLIYGYNIAAQSQVDKLVQMWTYICIPFLCTPNFHTKAPTDRRASESVQVMTEQYIQVVCILHATVCTFWGQLQYALQVKSMHFRMHPLFPLMHSSSLKTRQLHYPQCNSNINSSYGKWGALC